MRPFFGGGGLAEGVQMYQRGVALLQSEAQPRRCAMKLGAAGAFVGLLEGVVGRRRGLRDVALGRQGPDLSRPELAVHGLRGPVGARLGHPALQGLQHLVGGGSGRLKRSASREKPSCRAGGAQMQGASRQRGCGLASASALHTRARARGDGANLGAQRIADHLELGATRGLDVEFAFRGSDCDVQRATIAHRECETPGLPDEVQTVMARIHRAFPIHNRVDVRHDVHGFTLADQRPGLLWFRIALGEPRRGSCDHQGPDHDGGGPSAPSRSPRPEGGLPQACAHPGHGLATRLWQLLQLTGGGSQLNVEPLPYPCDHFGARLGPVTQCSEGLA